jgi:hypothetical protein
MDCRKAQELFDDLSRERLAPETATEVRQHLVDCTDCRVQEQRTARLQRLLALKRYEQPAPEYFDSFLSEFHHRVLAEARQPGRWEQVLGHIEEFLAVDSVRVWRYRFASAMGMAVVVGLMWMGVRQMDDPAGVASQTAEADSSLIFAETGRSTPSTIAAPLPSLLRVTPAEYQPAAADNAAVTPAPAQADSPSPRYVLDRISVTPASYDVPNVQF